MFQSDWILKLKSWQVFVGLMIFIVLYFVSDKFNLCIGIFPDIDLSAIFGISALMIFFTWVLLIGLSLNEISENPFHFNVVIFIIAVFFCVLGYSELQLHVLMTFDSNIIRFISFLLTFMTMIGIIYTFSNVAKSLISLETGEKVKFKNYIIEAILIFMFPIGVWIIQPILNSIYKLK